MSHPSSEKQKGSTLTGILKSMGPGLLMAGAAIGVSHLVQSTRAGAAYGFALVIFVILANIFKFPFFEYGPRYAVATGESLVEGYNRLGKWALALFIVMTICTMFAVQAAVTVVTAALASSLFGFAPGAVAWSAILLTICLGILLVGKYRFLDSFIKVVIVVLAITTVVAVIAAFRLGYQGQESGIFDGFHWERSNIIFLIALMGWMPAPVDIAVWHSIWTLERKRTTQYKPWLKESLFDFHLGYWGTAFLSLCFLSLGALVIFGTGRPLPQQGGAFAREFIDLYTVSLGDWAYFIISIAAFTTMFSTTITCLDAFPRVLKRATFVVAPGLKQNNPGDRIYWIWILVVAGGAIILLGVLKGSMTFMVDLATTLSFLIAPLLAILNFRLVTSKIMPSGTQPGLKMRIWSWMGIGFLTIFALIFLVYF